MFIFKPLESLFSDEETFCKVLKKASKVQVLCFALPSHFVFFYFLLSYALFEEFSPENE